METQIKIFLVDDDRFSLNIYKHELEYAGYKDVVTLGSSNECIRRLSEKPRVIFLDHNIDEMDGLDLLRRIRHYYPEIHVVMVSGQQSVGTAVQVLRHGAYDYIAKDGSETERMKSVLRKIGNENRKPEVESFVRSFIRNQGLIVLFGGIIFILQCGAIAYYYSSLQVSLLVMGITLLAIVIILSCNTRTGKCLRRNRPYDRFYK